MMKFLLPGLLLWLLSACTESQKNQTASLSFSFEWEKQESNTQASLRGLSVVDSMVVWASGSGGTFLKTTDGGSSWQAGQVPGADTVDFRDVAAMDANTAYLLSAGRPALIYKTVDGGNSWQLQYENNTEGIFFDAFAFWNEQHGIAMSDPVSGHFVLIATTDAGRQWHELPAEKIPAPMTGEAGFAGSGTGVAVQQERQVWFATGGGAARVFRSADGGLNWQVSSTPMQQGTASAGIFSLAFADSLQGVAVGGDYLLPADSVGNACFTEDGGASWILADSSPRGYRSGAAYVPPLQLFVAVGITGSDYSADGGRHWLPVDTVGYHAVQFAAETAVGWATGSQGRIARVRIVKGRKDD